MNIKNRLTKLENAAGVNSEYCTCQGGIQTRVIGPGWDQTEEYYQSQLIDAQKDEFCERCKKLIEKQFIIIEGIIENSPREAISGATQATFI